MPPLSRRQILRGLPLLAAPSLAKAKDAAPLRDIVFGSCLDTHEHPMLDATLKLPRDLFLFMGDNIYGDKGGLPMIREKYALLKNSRFFQGLQDKPILATWDDHDFGQNDGGASYPDKDEAQVEFWNWLDEPPDSIRRRKQGVYHSKTFGPIGERVQVILLDTRYFRSPLKKVPKEKALIGGPYVASDDPSATMLGEAQWQWLEQTLLQPAELRLIVSSIQFAPEVHGGECWANLPHERQRMLDLIQKTRAAGIVFLSGDRHWCEFSKIEGPTGYPIHDFTSSSMTQKHPRGTPTPNRNRFSDTTYHLPNVGHLQINWEAPDPTLRVDIVNQDGQSTLSHTMALSLLQPK
mgnify:FL=1